MLAKIACLRQKSREFMITCLVFFSNLDFEGAEVSFHLHLVNSTLVGLIQAGFCYVWSAIIWNPTDGLYDAGGH